jgi:hypothetical protein
MEVPPSGGPSRPRVHVWKKPCNAATIDAAAPGKGRRVCCDRHLPLCDARGRTVFYHRSANTQPVMPDRLKIAVLSAFSNW